MAPPKSFGRFLDHTLLPSVVFRHDRSPRAPRTYTKSPSIVGELRGPPPQPALYSPSPTGRSTFQSCLPSLTPRQARNSFVPLSSSAAAVRKTFSPTTEGDEYPTPP